MFKKNDLTKDEKELADYYEEFLGSY